MKQMSAHNLLEEEKLFQKFNSDLERLEKAKQEVLQQFKNLRNQYFNSYPQTLKSILSNFYQSIQIQLKCKYYDLKKIPLPHQNIFNLLNETKTNKKKVASLIVLASQNLKDIESFQISLKNELQQLMESKSSIEKELLTQKQQIEQEIIKISAFENYKQQPYFNKFLETEKKLNIEFKNLNTDIQVKQSDIITLNERITEINCQIQQIQNQEILLKDQKQKLEKDIELNVNNQKILEENWRNQKNSIEQQLSINQLNTRTISNEQLSQYTLYDDNQNDSIEANIQRLHKENPKSFKLLKYSSKKDYYIPGFSTTNCLASLLKLFEEIKNQNQEKTQCQITLIVESKVDEENKQSNSLTNHANKIFQLFKNFQCFKLIIFDKNIGKNLIFQYLHKELLKLNMKSSYNNIQNLSSSSEGSLNIDENESKNKLEYEKWKLEKQKNEIEVEIKNNTQEYQQNQIQMKNNLQKIIQKLNEFQSCLQTLKQVLSESKDKIQESENIIFQNKLKLDQVKLQKESNDQKLKKFIEEFKKDEKERLIYPFQQTLSQLEQNFELSQKNITSFKQFLSSIEKQKTKQGKNINDLKQFEEGMSDEMYSLYSIIWAFRDFNVFDLLSFAIQFDNQCQDLEQNLSANLQNIFSFNEQKQKNIFEYITFNLSRDQNDLRLKIEPNSKQEINEKILQSIINEIKSKLSPNVFNHMKKVNQYDTQQTFVTALEQYIKRL